MPRYIVRVKDQVSGQHKLYSYTADSSPQAKEMAEGDGLEVVEVMEDVLLQLPPGPPYGLLCLAGWIITACALVTAVVGVVMGFVGLLDPKGTPWFGWSLALSSVLPVGIGQSMLALRDIALNTADRPPVKRQS